MVTVQTIAPALLLSVFILISTSTFSSLLFCLPVRLCSCVLLTSKGQAHLCHIYFSITWQPFRGLGVVKPVIFYIFHRIYYVKVDARGKPMVPMTVWKTTGTPSLFWRQYLVPCDKSPNRARPARAQGAAVQRQNWSTWSCLSLGLRPEKSGQKGESRDDRCAAIRCLCF